MADRAERKARWTLRVIQGQPGEELDLVQAEWAPDYRTIEFSRWTSPRDRRCAVTLTREEFYALESA